MAHRKKTFPWHEKLLAVLLSNLKIAVAGVLLLVLAWFALASKGCGGGGSERSPSPNPPKAGKPVAAKLTIKSPKTPRKAVSDAEPMAPPPPPPIPSEETQDAAPENAVPENTAQPKKAVRPKGVADWTWDDYESASRRGDPQLLAAVDHLGARSADKDGAVEILTKLLELTGADSAAGGASQLPPSLRGLGNASYAKRNQNLADAVIAALAANGTPRAFQVLEGVVDGSQKVADRQVAAIAALNVLATHPGRDTEDLLYRVVVDASQVAEAGNLTVSDALKLRSTAIGLIRADASESLWVRLAGYMLAPETPKEAYDQLSACLKEPRPENLAAQVILYQSDRPDRTMRDWLEQRLVAYSSHSMSSLLSAAPQPPSKAASAKTLPVIDPDRVAQLLWSPDLAAAIEERLRALEMLDQDAPLIALASTVPSPPVRAALLRTLERHWDEGPNELKSLRTADDVTVEPGFAALVKMLPRNDLANPTAGNDAHEHNAAFHPAAKSTTDPKKSKRPEQAGQGSAKKTVDEGKTEQRQQKQIGQQWMEFSHDISQTICRRLCAAARAKQGSRSGAEWTAADIDLPFELRSHEDIVAVYHLDWPQEFNGTIAAVPMLRVRYVRIEQKAVPLKVLAYYRQQVANSKEHAHAGGGWIDSVFVDKETARTRSVDVLVAKASKAVLGLPSQEQELTVDILAIECEGLAKPSSASASR